MAYSRVLVATDFSENAVHAARWALRLASADGEVRFLTVLALPEPPGYLHGAQRDELIEIARDRRQEATATLEAWARRAGVPSPHAVVRDGPPAREIVREAIDFGADLVVLGARGMGKVERLLLGSTTRSVLRGVPCDALVVRGAGTGTPPLRRIVVATDFYGPSKAAGRRALSIARETAAELIAYHTIDKSLWAGVVHDEAMGARTGVDPAWIEKTTADMLHSYNVDVLGGAAKERHGHGRAPEDLARFAETEKADLLVVGTHGASNVARALLGSVAEGVVERATCTVLVARP